MAGGTPVFAYKGETLEDYWDYTHRIFEFGPRAGKTEGPNMILDDGGDATLLMHLGARPKGHRWSRLPSPAARKSAGCAAAIKAKLKTRTRPGTAAA